MNPSRLITFAEAYAVGLVAAIKRRPHQYQLKLDDTPESYAMRVCLKVAELIEASGLQFIQTETDSFRRACESLQIEHSESAIRAYLEGE